MTLDAVDVLGERGGVDDDFASGGGGVEEGEGVALPEGEADMGDVEAGDCAGEGDDVAGADVFGAGGKVCFGNVEVVAVFEVLLDGVDLGYVGGVVLELFVGCGMGGHEVELLGKALAATVTGDLSEESLQLALSNPFGSIVESGSVAVDDAVAVAERGQAV